MWHPADRLFTHLAADQPEAVADVTDTPHTCSYCGSQEFEQPEDTGRGLRAICSACGGAMLRTEDGQWSPAGPNATHNHPQPDGDPASGGVGGAANVGVDPDRMNDASARHGVLQLEAAYHDTTWGNAKPGQEVPCPTCHGHGSYEEDEPKSDAQVIHEGIPDDAPEEDFYNTVRKPCEDCGERGYHVRGTDQEELDAARAVGDHAMVNDFVRKHEDQDPHPDGIRQPSCPPECSYLNAEDKAKRDEMLRGYHQQHTAGGEDFRLQHQAPTGEVGEDGSTDGSPMHDLSQGGKGVFPEDVYTHSHYYDSGHPDYMRAWSTAKGARGNPEKKVKIYRALPAEHAHMGFNHGDWVSTSKEYARDHGRNDDPKHDWPVISTTVHAKHLHNEGDLMEWGYSGPHKGGMVAFKGGHHQEVSHRADGSVRPVQRKAPKPFAGWDIQHHLGDQGTDTESHHVTAYDPQENYAGHINRYHDGKTEVHVEPEHENSGLREHMLGMLPQHHEGALNDEVPWCAHLYHGNCTYPGDKLPNGTILGIPQDRGPCPWKHNAFQQAACPISAPGPMAVMQVSAAIKTAEQLGLFSEPEHVVPPRHEPAPLSWDEIGDRHPHIYGDSDIHGDAAAGADGPGIGDAANYLAHERPEEPDGEQHSVHDLNFHEERVHPRHIDYSPSGRDDYRVSHAMEGYRTHPETMPPLVLVKRHNVYQVADGHHRAEAADALNVPVRAYVAHSPYPDEPFRDGEKGPFHRAEPVGPSTRHEASWTDVRDKAKRIRREGGVIIVVSSTDGVAGEVQGDHHVYETAITWVPGTTRTAAWSCGCMYGAYGHGPRWDNRPCSHVLAMRFEAQSRSAHGREIEVDQKRPDWLKPQTSIVTQYERPSEQHPQGRDLARREVPPGNMRTEWHGRSRTRRSSLEHTAAIRVAQNLFAQDVDPAEVIEQLVATGATRIEAQLAVLAARGRVAIQHTAKKCPECGAELDSTAGQCDACGAVLPDRTVTHKAKKGPLQKPHTCKYCQQPATKAVKHSEGMAYIPTCDQHLDDAQEAAANCLPYGGGPDYTNIDGVVDLPQKTSVAQDDGRMGIATSMVLDGLEERTASWGDDEQHCPHCGGYIGPSAFKAGKCPHCGHALAHHTGAIDLDYRPHRTQDARSDAPVFGKGVDDWGLTLVDCPQCGGKSGCGHCGGNGQVISTGGTTANPTPDQNPVAGDAIREDGISDVSSLHAQFAAKKTPGPSVAGVALKAADTGRVLMIQRDMTDEKDPARGRWEWPGGHSEQGDRHSLDTAVREFEEEVGHPFPEGGVVHHTWTSPNGVYQGHVVVIPEESAVSFADGRSTVNPDDPGGDHHEQSVWWEIAHAKKNPALRDECKSSPWSAIQKAGDAKTASFNVTPSFSRDNEIDGGATDPHLLRESHTTFADRMLLSNQADSSLIEFGNGISTAAHSVRGEVNSSTSGVSIPHVVEIGTGEPMSRVLTSSIVTAMSNVQVAQWADEVFESPPMSTYHARTTTGVMSTIPEDAIPTPIKRASPGVTSIGTARSVDLGFVSSGRSDQTLTLERHAPTLSGIGLGSSTHEAAAWDPLYGLEEASPQTPPAHSDSENPASTGFLTTQDPTSWSQVTKTPHHLLPADSLDSPMATLHSVPEGALPFTDGDIEDSTSGTDDDFRSQTGDNDSLDGDTDTIPDTEMEGSPMDNLGGTASRSVSDIVARFQATAGAKALQSGSGGGETVGFSDGEIAAKAQERLAGMSKTALKNFTFAEQQELIGEGKGSRARNFGDLSLEGTHYSALEEALKAADVSDDDILIL